VISAPSTRRYTVVLSLGVVSRSQQLCQTCWPRRSCQDLDVDVCAAPFPLLGLRRLSQILQTCKISELWLHLHDYGITGSGEDNYHLHSHPAPQSLLDRRNVGHGGAARTLMLMCASLPSPCSGFTYFCRYYKLGTYQRNWMDGAGALFCLGSLRQMNLCDLSSIDSARWMHGRSTSSGRSTWRSWTRSSHHDTRSRRWRPF
jgi:hypothetical protein